MDELSIGYYNPPSARCRSRWATGIHPDAGIEPPAELVSYTIQLLFHTSHCFVQLNFVRAAAFVFHSIVSRIKYRRTPAAAASESGSQRSQRKRFSTLIHQYTGLYSTSSTIDCIMALLHLQTKTTKNPCRTLQILSFISHFSTSFLITKIPKKFKKKRKQKESPRTKLVQTQPNIIPHFESILLRDAHFRFLTKTKEYLSKQTHHVLLLDEAGKLHQQLGFPRGRKVLKSIQRHPLIFETYRHSDNKMWFGFTDFMDNLLAVERSLLNELEQQRVDVVRKLLMMSTNKRIPLSKIYHNRLLFGIPEDFRDRIAKYPDHFRVIVEDDGKRILELLHCDDSLAVSSLEKKFLVDEEKVKRAFKFPIKHVRALELDIETERKLNMLNTLPLVSPYSDGSKLDLWRLEAEKYRLGIIHEFLSLTLEKRAYIHNIVEFKDEFNLTKHTYQMLQKQRRTFHLAGTEMNWCVFLKDAYAEDGMLIDKDPQVSFNEKLYHYADMKELDADKDV